MQTLRRTLFASLALLALAACLPLMSRAQSAQEKAVLDAESARFEAQVKRDVPTLNLAIADQAIYVHANGVQQTKAEYLHDVEAGTSRYRNIEASDRSVQFIGNLAITHGAITLSVGVDRQINGRYSGVYLQKDGRWQVVSFQTTPLMARQ